YSPSGNRLFEKGTKVKIPPEVLQGKALVEITPDEFKIFIPIKNEPACQGCHKEPGLRAVVLARAPLTPVKESIAQTRWKLMLYGVLLLGTSIAVVSILFKTQIEAPLRAILNATKDLSGGRFVQIEQESPVREFEFLRNAFNHMSQSLRAFHEQMEELVQVRTAQYKESSEKLLRLTETLSQHVQLLEALSTLPHTCLRADLPPREALREYLTRLRDLLQAEQLCLYLLDRERGVLSLAHAVNTPVEIEHEKLKRTALKSSPHLIEAPNNLVYSVPVLTSTRNLCWEVKKCLQVQCPVFGRDDMECWTVMETHCEVHGPDDCLHCNALPVEGVLLCSFKDTPAEYIETILKVASAQVSSIVELLQAIASDRQLLNYLSGLSEMAMRSFRIFSIKDLPYLLRNSVVKEAFEGFGIWTFEGKDLKCLHNEGIPEETTSICSNALEELFSTGKVLMEETTSSGSFIVGLIGPTNEPLGGICLYKRQALSDVDRTFATVLCQVLSRAVENIVLKQDLITQAHQNSIQRDFFERVFKSIQSGIMVLDDTWNILNVNPYILKLFDLNEDDILNRNLRDVLDGLYELLRSPNKEGWLRYRGKDFYIGYNEFPFHGPEGIRGRVVLFRDLTEIIKLRKQLERQRYFSTIGEMASWIAHEIKNPLFVITSMASFIKKYPEGDQTPRFIQSILDEAKRINKLVQDLLEFGKPLELKPTHIDLKTFLENLLQDMNFPGIQTRLHVQEQKNFTVRIDKERFRQVMVNILINAKEAGAKNVDIAVVHNQQDIV
ncbi:MAG: PAS domain-containing protein, partial [Nitrospirae bacterium]